ncbi:3-dehydroquinate dehydratase [Schleiferiaceae bacterium]|jgi:3-dehydroquinate dehydratase-2|nr:3-dehydroquinate dehydratase [Schleiferiaceae bacterium]MDA8571266.1 3-dehydroquinate dehydratase [Schleiferiaceae bacterium]MDA8819640.1 3-dehydroquinate dehydratase [Schleiferiaceae bacterium]PSR07166.1 MAG: 3-dehydroquinate dehydratase [Bacteroidota bacterium]
MRILILNGPNLNLLGKREPDIYGNSNFQEFYEELSAVYDDVASFNYLQSNVEGELINILQSSQTDYQAIIFNAGGYTHTSVALADCIAAISVPVIEVHISQPAAREEFRHKSLIAGKCIGSISGFGLDSYRLAVEALIQKKD